MVTGHLLAGGTDGGLAPCSDGIPQAIMRGRRYYHSRKDAFPMTVSTMQLTTRLRTWARVAGLIGLLIAFGALIGGSFLWLFAGLAIAINLARIEAHSVESSLLVRRQGGSLDRTAACRRRQPGRRSWRLRWDPRLRRRSGPLHARTPKGSYGSYY